MEAVEAETVQNPVDERQPRSQRDKYPSAKTQTKDRDKTPK